MEINKKFRAAKDGYISHFCGINSIYQKILSNFLRSLQSVGMPFLICFSV